MKNLCFCIYMGLMASAIPVWAGAQSFTATSDIPELESIVVIAKRSGQSPKEALGDVSVIDHFSLKQAGANSLAEIMTHTNGIELTQSGGPQSNTGLFIRGANSNQTLVLLNGIRINSSITGTAFLETLAPDLFDRIEILRGSSSSLYGADAIGGVINLITHQTQDDQRLKASASLGYGTNDTRGSHFILSGAANHWDYAFAGQYKESRGFNATTTKNSLYNPDRDGYRQQGFVTTVGYRWLDRHHIGLTLLEAKLNSQYDAGADFASGEYFDDRAITRQKVYALTSTDDLTDNWQSILRAGYSQDTQRNIQHPTFFYPTGISDFGSVKTQYTWQNNFKLSTTQQLSLLVEGLKEKVTGTTQYPIPQRHTYSVGGVYGINQGPHHLQINARNDAISAHQNELTGSLAYSYDLNADWRIGAAANTGFKMPTFTDLYYPSYGNPHLKPEKSRNIEVNLRYTAENTRMDLVAYRNHVRDLIVSSAATGYIPYNVDHAVLEGLSLSAEQTIANTVLGTILELQYPHDQKTGKQLAKRSKQILRVKAQHRMGALQLGTEWSIFSKRYDDAANTKSLGGYSLLNLFGSYDFNPQWQAQIRWNNVLNKYYTLVDGYQTMGTNVFASLTWHL